MFAVLAGALGNWNLGAAQPDAEIRVNQAGFLADDNKPAWLMAGATESNATFRVIDAAGKAVLTASVGGKTGSWNPAYPYIYRLDFSSVKNPGIYSIEVNGPVPAVSPPVQIGAGSDIFAPLLRHSLFFFQAQRDGPDVLPSVINRKPSHLTDRHAFVYQVPAFGKNGMQGGLEKIGGPVDVSGGWFDAGDYLKFVETASYVTAVMLQAARDWPAQAGPGGTADFAAEGRHGLDWLLKMWNDNTRTLYAQVGLGDGNQNVTGDHDVWRLPEADDAVTAQPGEPQYFIKYRPVFPANSPGGKISPNLAGRLAAAFALGAQVFKTSDPAYARKLLLNAEDVFDRAATTNITTLITAYPHDFYPEEEWRDDLTWGAVELHLALLNDPSSAGLPHFDPAAYLQQAAHWARAYLDSGSQDSLNLYDVSSLADYDLCRAIEKSAGTAGLGVSRAELLAHLKQELDRAVNRSKKNAFGPGVRYAGGDLVPHVLGLVVEAGLYDDLTHTTAYADFARRQLDFVLGANPWGTSFIVGAGKVFPFHMQHQVANLAGSLDGTAPLVLGATVDGPARGRATQGDVPDGARPTPWPDGKNPFAPFNGNGVQYTDDVSSWATVEPADDYTVPTVLIFARLAGQK